MNFTNRSWFASTIFSFGSLWDITYSRQWHLFSINQSARRMHWLSREFEPIPLQFFSALYGARSQAWGNLGIKYVMPARWKWFLWKVLWSLQLSFEILWLTYTDSYTINKWSLFKTHASEIFVMPCNGLCLWSCCVETVQQFCK